MQTFQNIDDITLKKFPQTPLEWSSDPTIKFSIDRKSIVHPGDRIYCCTKMITSGANSGGIAQIYYYIDEITEVKPNVIQPSLLTDITAKAIRREL